MGLHVPRKDGPKRGLYLESVFMSQFVPSQVHLLNCSKKQDVGTDGPLIRSRRALLIHVLLGMEPPYRGAVHLSPSIKFFLGAKVGSGGQGEREERRTRLSKKEGQARVSSAYGNRGTVGRWLKCR